MILRRLCARDFRNLAALEFTPCAGVNVLCGDNAQGKTNLIEALWLLTGAKSFRQCRETELVRRGAQQARLFAEFSAQGREQTAELLFSPARTMKLNGLSVESAAELAGLCGGVVFSPLQMFLFQDGPKERRRLLDTSLCQLSPKYLSVLTEYTRILRQRNSLLKDLPQHPSLREVLEVFDRQLAVCAGYLVHTRQRYCLRLEEYAKTVYAGISGGREEFSARYRSTFAPPGGELDISLSREEREELFLRALAARREEDLRLGTTTLGPHRDDLETALDGQPVRAFGSQGQQRSCILALKLAEARLLGEALREPPLVLLDDVMSELDASRRSYILNSIGESQVFLTCCDESLFQGLQNGEVFFLRAGELSGRR